MPLVKRSVMLIAEFCRQAALSRDSVRHYVKLILSTPVVGTCGSNRDQPFGNADIRRAALIRTGQQLGFTRKQMVALNREYGAGAMDTACKLGLVRGQLQAIEEQTGCIRMMKEYLRGKIAGREDGEWGVGPVFRGTDVVGPCCSISTTTADG